MVSLGTYRIHGSRETDNADTSQLKETGKTRETRAPLAHLEFEF